MKGALLWLAGTAAAFAVTAGVFLALAELGTDPPERSLSADESRQAGSNPLLSLEFSQQSLESLKEQESQRLSLTLYNNGEQEITDINVYLALFSEDTSDRHTRYYEAHVEKIEAGGSREVRFELDLSPPDDGRGGSSGASASGEDSSQESMNILEARAASSDGFSTIKTAVLAL